MRKSFSLVLVVFALSFGIVVVDQPSSCAGSRVVALQRDGGEQPRDVFDRIDRFVRLLKHIFRPGTNGDGMTPPKP